MKNFLGDFLTGVTAILVAISFFIMIFSGIGLYLQKPNIGLVFIISLVSFICLTIVTVKGKGGWSELIASIIPW